MFRLFTFWIALFAAPAFGDAITCLEASKVLGHEVTRELTERGEFKQPEIQEIAQLVHEVRQQLLERFPNAIPIEMNNPMLGVLVKDGILTNASEIPLSIRTDGELTQWMAKRYAKAMLDRTVQARRINARAEDIRSNQSELMEAALKSINQFNRTDVPVEPAARHEHLSRRFNDFVTRGQLEPLGNSGELYEFLKLGYEKRGGNLENFGERTIEEITEFIITEAIGYQRAAHYQSEAARHNRERIPMVSFIDSATFHRMSPSERAEVRPLTLASGNTNRWAGELQTNGFRILQESGMRYVGGVRRTISFRPPSEFNAELSKAAKRAIVNRGEIPADYVDYVWRVFNLETPGGYEKALELIRNGDYDGGPTSRDSAPFL